MLKVEYLTFAFLSGMVATLGLLLVSGRLPDVEIHMSSWWGLPIIIVNSIAYSCLYATFDKVDKTEEPE